MTVYQKRARTKGYSEIDLAAHASLDAEQSHIPLRTFREVCRQ